MSSWQSLLHYVSTMTMNSQGDDINFHLLYVIQTSLSLSEHGHIHKELTATYLIRKPPVEHILCLIFPYSNKSMEDHAQAKAVTGQGVTCKIYPRWRSSPSHLYSAFIPSISTRRPASRFPLFLTDVSIPVSLDDSGSWIIRTFGSCSLASCSASSNSSCKDVIECIKQRRVHIYF